MLGERIQMEVGPIDIVRGQEYEDIITASSTAPAEATRTTEEEAPGIDDEEKETAVAALLDQTADQANQGPDEQSMSKGDLQSDSFRMFSFKVVQCKNQDDGHDWTECPFAHAGEKANRRDPRIHQYTGVSCPDYRKGACKRGSACPYAHGVFEVWLHPSRYRTQLCKDAPNCTRQVCFFAHSAEELRHVEPEDLPLGMLTYALGAKANGASGANRMLRVPLDIALEAAALKASAASAGLQCDTFGSLDMGCKAVLLASAPWRADKAPLFPHGGGALSNFLATLCKLFKLCSMLGKLA
eukprot:gene5675-5913_t